MNSPSSNFSSWLAAVVAFAIPSLAAADETTAPLPRRPNVLFIAVDDLRPSLGSYGDALARTPNLDSLAESGTIFTRAYCQQALCSPSRSSLLTGMRPDSTGVTDLTTHFRKNLPDAVTLPQLFKNNGYRVVGRGKIFHGDLDDPASWDSTPKEGASFHSSVYAERSASPVELSKDWQENEAAKGPAFEIAEVSDDAYPDGQLASEAVSLLRDLKSGGKPFFLAVGFSKPHLPFAAPKKYWDLFDPEKLWPPPMRALPEGVTDLVSPKAGELRNNYSGMPPKGETLPLELEKTLRHGYYAATAYVDAQIGRVLDTLKSEGLDESTIVVLWGDHGYLVGDFGTWCKHSNFEVAVRSPLVIRAPGFPAGQRVGATVEFVDIYPTLADLCKLAPPEGLEGTSLIPFLRDPQRPADKPAFSQYPRGNAQKPIMGRSVRTERWRFTEWARTDTGEVLLREFYDFANDPECTRNHAQDPALANIVSEHSQLLKEKFDASIPSQ